MCFILSCVSKSTHIIDLILILCSFNNYIYFSHVQLHVFALQFSHTGNLK